MEKKQPTFTFTITFTLGGLLALHQSLDNLKQSILQSCDMQLRTIDLLEKWERQSPVKPLNENVSNDNKGAN
jgi:hypothetical protein